MKLGKLSDMNKKLIKYIIFVIIGIIALFIIIGIVKLVKGNVLAFDKIEDKMVKAAEEYYKDNSHLLPENDVDQSEVSISTLVEAGYIKDLEKYTAKDVDCTGKLVMLKNGSHYTFIPKLNCGGDYSTNTLVDKMTSKANIVTSGDGLYEIAGEYVFRGEKLNNYVSFAGKIWRVLRITKDNEIRLIQNDVFEQEEWDDRYNEAEKTTSGFNKFEVSRIKDSLEALYNGKTFSAVDKAKIVPKQLCIGARKSTDKTVDGSIECASVTEELYPLGLIQANEFLIASLDAGCVDLDKRQCSNYNYLSNFEKKFWTITPDKDSTSAVYYIDYLSQSAKARYSAYVRLAINIAGEVNYTKGNGSLEKPYIID